MIRSALLPAAWRVLPVLIGIGIAAVVIVYATSAAVDGYAEALQAAIGLFLS